MFVEFPDAEVATKEQKAISGRLFAGHVVRAELKSRQTDQSPEQQPSNGTVDTIDFSRLLISGLTPAVTLSDLQTLFPAAESVRMPTASNGANYGWVCAFVLVVKHPRNWSHKLEDENW